jgi:hypothetical protein
MNQIFDLDIPQSLTSAVPGPLQETFEKKLVGDGILDVAVEIIDGRAIISGPETDLKKASYSLKNWLVPQ